MKNNRPSTALSLVLIVLSFTSIVYTFIKQVELSNKEKSLSEQVKKEVQDTIGESLNAPSEYPDYSSLTSLHKLVLADNLESWTPRAAKNPNKVVKTVIIDKGNLANGYVYIKANVEGRVLTKWDSIYMTMNYRGGHLYRPESLPVPSGHATELLYALNDIPYLINIPYNEQISPARTDWFNLFYDSNRIVVEAFISSLRKGNIIELILYYSCEANNDCSLSIAK